MVSGGGNDVVGKAQTLEILNRYEAGMSAQGCFVAEDLLER